LPSNVRDRVMALAEPLVLRLGYELVDIEWVSENDSQVLRVFIDHTTAAKGHISVEDCEVVSRELSVLLDSADPVPEEYLLEVSSPGFDRVLRTPAHFARFVGERVKIELLAPNAGQRRYTGTLLAVNDTGIELEVDTGQVLLPFAQIGKARIAA
jgi:ribosome maturation factor RimP